MMLSSRYLLTFLVLGLLNLVLSRQPLINKQGRFTFVDNIKTIGLNESSYTDRPQNELVRRAITSSCRGRCSKKATDHLSVLRKRSFDRDLHDEFAGPKTGLKDPQSLTKRQFAHIDPTPDRMDTYLRNRFNNNRNMIRVLTPETIGNSAEFRKFEIDGVNLPFEMGLEGLCGCSIIVIVSKEAVWFAHIFEDNSFDPHEDYARGRSPQTMFQLTALNFLDTGIDAIFGVQFQSLRGVRDFFPVEDELTSAFIVTPQKERDAAVDGDTSADTSVYYIDGLMYDWAIILLIQKIQALIPGIPVTVHQYQALNAAAPDADEAFDTRRGKALFQYDPQARPGRRGVRLYFEEHRALNHFWAPEERSLSESESQYTTQLSCAGQSYSRVQYTCYSDLLCPILDGIRTLRCAAQCYLESLYTCYDERKLCPVVNGNPTLPCGDDCYLPSEYSCNESKLVQISHNNPEQSAGSTGSSASSTQSTSITTITTSPGDNPSGVPGSHAEIIFSGTTYTIGTQTTTIVQDEHTIIFGPNGLIIGTYTVAFPSSQTEPVALTTDGITITFLPGPTSSASSRTSSSPRSTGQSVTTGPTPGPTPTSVLPSSTSNPTSFPSLPAATSTVLTLTALDGLSTVEITYTPTTISQLTTITGTTTVTTNIDGLPTSIVVGPGGLVWKSVTASTRITGFPPIPEPTIPPVPRSSSALPTQTSTLTSDDMFPSSQFTLPPIVTTVVTSDSPDGPVATTITGTTDSSGVVVPITTLSAAAAISSAISLASELSSVSDAVIAFSSSTADSSKASSAAAVIKDAQSGTSGFGHGLEFSLPGLCLIFCNHVSSAGFILDSIGNTLSAILDGTASLGSLTGPLTEISVIASELVDDAKEAEASENSSATSNPQPSTTSASCSTGAPVTNCEVFCATSTISENVSTTSCFSTTCSVETRCGAQVSTSTSFEQHSCPLVWPTGGGIAIWSYPGYTYTTVSPDPTDLPQADENGDPITSTVEPSTTQPSSTPSPISSSTETSSVTTETLPVTTDVPSTTTTQTPTSTTDAPADMMTGCNHIKSNFPNDPETCNEFVENFDVTVTKLMELNPILRSSDGSCSFAAAWAKGLRNFCLGARSVTTTTTTASPGPTAVTKCDSYKDCPRCQDGYYRCCLSGCHGMLAPGSNTCGCIKDGETVGASCGCK